ncbi:MAG: CRP-like cAMP-binding protein [Desulforhopalus sp.]|jgi:CRP-like cAMP-binding protein
MVEYQTELHGFFNSILADEDVVRLFQVIESVEIKKSGILFDVGQDAEGMYFVISGKMAVQKETGFGARKQVVALLDRGAPVGEAGLLDGGLRGASVVAVEDASLLYLSRKAFDEICEELPGLGLVFFRWLLGRVSLRLKGSTERLAHIL